MARRARPAPQHTGLFHAREARRMSRSELVRLSGVSKQQLSRLENGHIRLRLDHLKPFAAALGYTPEQILLWGRYPGTPTPGSSTEQGADSEQHEPAARVPELNTRQGQGTGRGTRRAAGSNAERLKSEDWYFPASFVREQLHTSPQQLRVIEASGDGMVPTIAAGERALIDIGHKTPAPDGLYAIRDAFQNIVIKRLQVLMGSRPPRVKVISDNPNHPSEEAALEDIAIVGKVICCLKLF
jgi:phage repressor protein C with HTH and peptisase S24 domain